ADVLALKQLIERQKPVCVVIDPAYLAMGGDHSRDLFAMGQLLRPLTELCKSTGCTVLVVHHCKRSSKAGDPATLDDVAGSGFAEFSAQWLLLSRRRPFDAGTGKHELWLTGGSRVGHHGLWELDIDEGTVDQPGGCMWKTALRPVTSAEAQVDERFAAASEDRRLRRRAAAFGHQRQRVWEVLAAYPDGCNATVIRDALGINGERMKRILQVLVDERVVQKTEEQIDRRRFKVTYQRIPSVLDFSAAAIEARRASPPDQKVYNLRSGHFVDRSGTGAVGPKLVGWITNGRLRAVGPGTPTNPLADKPPVPPIEGVEVLPPPKSGPDTFSNQVGTQDVAQTQSNAAVQPQPPQGGDRA
ncbi:MAG TPA: AAA family ATPase, partial [Planctomycetaceae bacterium]|nr:AAA family ATPase [Planctomycetaceae bacterium]